MISIDSPAIEAIKNSDCISWITYSEALKGWIVNSKNSPRGYQYSANSEDLTNAINQVIEGFKKDDAFTKK